MTFRLIALWVLVLTGLAGMPAGDWTTADARAAKAQDVAHLAAALPRADRVAADGTRLERLLVVSDEGGGTGEGSAAGPAAADIAIQRPRRASAAFFPDGPASGVPAGHGFSARAPPSA